MVRITQLTFITVFTVALVGCPKKAPQESAPEPASAPTQAPTPTDDNSVDPNVIAQGFCACVLKNPRTTDRENGIACVTQLMADNGVTEPDPTLPPYTRTLENGATQTMPRIFASDEKMDVYAAATQACMFEIGKIDASFKNQTWLEAPCEQQCSTEPEDHRPLCMAYCNAEM